MAGDDGDDDGVVGCRQSDCGFGTMSWRWWVVLQ